MKQLRRVVWSEGMYLAPQHFQTQSRYVEDSIQFATQSLWFRPYGLAACEMDAEALRNGTVALLAAKGVMPDGLGFQIPESDSKPDVRAIDEAFSPTRDSHTVMLALPERRDRGINFGLTGPPGEYRYHAANEVLIDETTGLEERAVSLGRRTFRLLLDTEVSQGMVALPLARIRRDGSGRYVYDPRYIPPCLDIAASTRLITMLRELAGVLEERSRLMGSQQRSSGQAPADYWRRDLASFWFLHTIHGSLGVLRHLLLAKHGHPEELWQELGRLGGALCSFSLDSHPRDLPLYDHDRLTDCFEALEAHIRRHLDLIVPVNVVTVPLQPTEDYFWTATINDARLIDRSRWLLEIQSKVGEASLIARTPQLVKVCSEKYVRELVRRAMPGLALTHLPVPPPQVSARVEAQYFGVSKAGPSWESIVKHKQIGIYVPGDLPSPELSLIILLDN
jgi:type VI secretion system protein ImpJ